MSYGTPYIDEPKLYRKKAVGRASKMPNNNKTQTVEQSKPGKKYAKTRGEHYKDIVIAILIAGVVAFVAGVHYADTKNAQMQSAVKAASITAQQPVKK